MNFADSPSITGLNVSSIGVNEITWSWTPPDTLCEIKAYNFSWITKDLENNALGSEKVIVPWDKNEFLVNDLLPYTQVTFCVSSWTYTDVATPKTCAQEFSLPARKY